MTRAYQALGEYVDACDRGRSSAICGRECECSRSSRVWRKSNTGEHEEENQSGAISYCGSRRIAPRRSRRPRERSRQVYALCRQGEEVGADTFWCEASELRTVNLPLQLITDPLDPFVLNLETRRVQY